MARTRIIWDDAEQAELTTAVGDYLLKHPGATLRVALDKAQANTLPANRVRTITGALPAWLSHAVRERFAKLRHVEAELTSARAQIEMLSAEKRPTLADVLAEMTTPQLAGALAERMVQVVTDVEAREVQLLQRIRSLEAKEAARINGK